MRSNNTCTLLTRSWLPLAALATALTLPGCDSTSTGGNVSDRPVARAVRDPVLQDIPKPAGFVLDEQQSLAISAGRMRLAKCQYSGGLVPKDVKRFYEEYMPQAGFALRRWSLDHGEFNMRFESDTEVCTVRVRPKGYRSSLVVVELEPKPRGNPINETPAPARRPH